MTATAVYGFFCSGDKVLVHVIPGSTLDDPDTYEFVGAPLQETNDALATIKSEFRRRAGLEISNFGVAQFVIRRGDAECLSYVVTGRASESELDAASKLKFVPLTDVVAQQDACQFGGKELLVRVATMGFGYDLFVKNAREQVFGQATTIVDQPALVSA